MFAAVKADADLVDLWWLRCSPILDLNPVSDVSNFNHDYDQNSMKLPILLRRMNCKLLEP